MEALIVPESSSPLLALARRPRDVRVERLRAEPDWLDAVEVPSLSRRECVPTSLTVIQITVLHCVVGAEPVNEHAFSRQRWAAQRVRDQHTVPVGSLINAYV